MYAVAAHTICGHRVARIGAIFLALGLMAGCSNSQQDQTPMSSTDIAASFPDGTYSCEVTDTTDDDGPYDLTCDKSGSEVVAHFDNGGYVTGELDGASKDQLVFSGTDSRDRDWQFVISR